MDGASYPYPEGWILSYDVDLSPSTENAYQVTDSKTNVDAGGGVWMDGAGLAAGHDSYGVTSIYPATGNGYFDLDSSGGVNGSDSLLKLTTHLTLATSSGITPYFTPSDQCHRDCESGGTNVDSDFGSGGVLLVPDNTLPNHWPFIMLNGDKEGFIWVEDRTSLGGYNGANTSYSHCSSDTSCVSSCTNACQAPNLMDQQVSPPSGQTWHIHTSPAFWSGTSSESPSVYYIGNQGFGPKPTRFPLCDSSSGGPICASSTWQFNNSEAFKGGATPAVSWDGTNANSAIVWAILNPADALDDGSGLTALRAFSATSMALLYDSHADCPTRDNTGPGTKFSVPTVANGLVFMGTQLVPAGHGAANTDFDIFGPVSATCN